MWVAKYSRVISVKWQKTTNAVTAVQPPENYACASCLRISVFFYIVVIILSRTEKSRLFCDFLIYTPALSAFPAHFPFPLKHQQFRSHKDIKITYWLPGRWARWWNRLSSPHMGVGSRYILLLKVSANSGLKCSTVPVNQR